MRFMFLAVQLAAVACWGQYTSVKQFGATGDGTTDDTVAIQAALTAAQRGKVILFPSGTYRISATLTIKPQAHAQKPPRLLGEGKRNSELVWAGPAGGDMIVANDPSGSHSPVIIEGLGFASKSRSLEAGTAIRLQHIGQGAVRNCNFSWTLDGIVLQDTYLSETSFNYFSTDRDGIVANTSVGPANGNIIGPNNIWGFCGRYCINIGGGDTYKIISNDFEGTHVPGTIASINVVGTDGTTISFNRFEDSQTSTTFRSIILNGAHFATVSQNYWSGGNVPYYITVTGTGQGIKFTGNGFGVAAQTANIEVHPGSTDISSVGDIHNSAHPFGGAIANTICIGDYKAPANVYVSLRGTEDGGNSTGASVVYINGKNFANLNGPPSTGTWNKGDIVWNRAWDPVDSPSLGWVCAVGGTPCKQWKPFLTVQ